MNHERIFLDRLSNYLGGWLGDAYCHLSSNCTMGFFDCGGNIRADWQHSRILNLDGFSMNKQKASDWLINNVKKWPTVDNGKRPKTPAKTCWHFDLASKSWQLYVNVGEDEPVFITQGDWSIEKGRIAAEKQKVRTDRFEQKMEEKGYVRWNGRIPNKLEARAKMANLAAKLRGEKNGD